MEILRACNLSFAYDYTLFKKLNISLNYGKSIAILGASGCGKSTLLYILSSLLRPQEGEIIYKDKSLYELDYNELLKIRRLDFGIIFQSHYLFRGFSALENIQLASVLSKQKIDNKILKDLGISEILTNNVGNLSGGQQQRISIARVLVKKPKIIFADEPTGNLDKKTANEVMDILLKYIEDESASLFLVTHDISQANKCNEVYSFNDSFLKKNSYGDY